MTRKQIDILFWCQRGEQKNEGIDCEEETVFISNTDRDGKGKDRRIVGGMWPPIYALQETQRVVGKDGMPVDSIKAINSAKSKLEAPLLTGQLSVMGKKGVQTVGRQSNARGWGTIWERRRAGWGRENR